MADRTIVNEWVDKAEEDYLFTKKHLQDEESFFAPLCFHCQQAAEKYLKAYCVAQNLPLQKIHDLKKLIKLCIAHEPAFGEIAEDAVKLNPYYIDTRYPAVWPVGTMKADAEEALAAAGRIRDFVKTKLNIR